MTNGEAFELWGKSRYPGWRLLPDIGTKEMMHDAWDAALEYAGKAKAAVTIPQQGQPKTVSLCVGCKVEDCEQRSEVGGVVTVCAMRKG